MAPCRKLSWVYGHFCCHSNEIKLSNTSSMHTVTDTYMQCLSIDTLSCFVGWLPRNSLPNIFVTLIYVTFPINMLLSCSFPLLVCVGRSCLVLTAEIAYYLLVHQFKIQWPRWALSLFFSTNIAWVAMPSV